MCIINGLQKQLYAVLIRGVFIFVATDPVSLTVELGDKSALIVSLAAPLATLATTKQQLSG